MPPCRSRVPGHRESTVNGFLKTAFFLAASLLLLAFVFEGAGVLVYLPSFAYHGVNLQAFVFRRTDAGSFAVRSVGLRTLAFGLLAVLVVWSGEARPSVARVVAARRRPGAASSGGSGARPDANLLRQRTRCAAAGDGHDVPVQRNRAPDARWQHHAVRRRGHPVPGPRAAVPAADRGPRRADRADRVRRAFRPARRATDVPRGRGPVLRRGPAAGGRRGAGLVATAFQPAPASGNARCTAT